MSGVDVSAEVSPPSSTTFRVPAGTAAAFCTGLGSRPAAVGTTRTTVRRLGSEIGFGTATKGDDVRLLLATEACPPRAERRQAPTPTATATASATTITAAARARRRCRRRSRSRRRRSEEACGFCRPRSSSKPPLSGRGGRLTRSPCPRPPERCLNGSQGAVSRFAPRISDSGSSSWIRPNRTRTRGSRVSGCISRLCAQSPTYLVTGASRSNRLTAR